MSICAIIVIVFALWLMGNILFLGTLGFALKDRTANSDFDNSAIAPNSATSKPSRADKLAPAAFNGLEEN